MSIAGIEYLEERVTEAIDYCRQEFDMTVAEAIGTLEVCKYKLLLDEMDDDD